MPRAVGAVIAGELGADVPFAARERLLPPPIARTAAPAASHFLLRRDMDTGVSLLVG